MARRWSDLSDRNRKVIIAVAVGEAVLKTAVLIDISRRPASQIRGSKRMWIIRGGGRQLRRARITVILRLRASACCSRRAGRAGRGLSHQLSDDPDSRTGTSARLIYPAVRGPKVRYAGTLVRGACRHAEVD